MVEAAPVVPGNRRPGDRVGQYGWVRLALVLALLLLGAVAALGWAAYSHVGRTPQELLDHLDKRLIGHPRLEMVAKPVIALARSAFGVQPAVARHKTPFHVPRLPTLVRLPEGASVGTGVGAPGAAGGRVLRVGPLEDVRTIAEAAKKARDGDVVEIASGEYVGDVAVWHQKKLTIRSVGGRARLIAAGKSAEDKAIWVIRRGDFEVSGIEFVGAKVSDKNGAGIRFEGGRLRIQNCLFWGGENGVLTAAIDPKAVLEIENSEFGYNGAGDGLSHHIYVGAIAKLKVVGSYFHHANRGHLLKSRAAVNEIFYNRLTDEDGGRASYELEFPNGGDAVVVGNIIQQTSSTENSSMIAFGLEGFKWPSNRLYLASNTVINDHPQGGSFIRARPHADRIVSANNLWIGQGGFVAEPAVQSINDVRGDWALFEAPSRYNYKLSAKGQQHAFRPFAIADDGGRTTPDAQYAHGTGSSKLTMPPRYVGAMQQP